MIDQTSFTPKQVSSSRPAASGKGAPGADSPWRPHGMPFWIGAAALAIGFLAWLIWYSNQTVARRNAGGMLTAAGPPPAQQLPPVSLSPSASPAASPVRR
jgi:zona occludens toxin (predicted ATPase)